MVNAQGDTTHFVTQADSRGARHHWKFVIALILVTLIFRLVFLAGPVGSDDTRYMDAAWKVAYGQPAGLMDNAYVRAAWIIWLAGWTKLGLGGTALVFTQVLVSIGLVLTLYWLGRKLTGDPRAAFLGALCWVFFPIELTYAGMVLPDEFAVLLVLLAAGLALAALRAPEQQPKPLHLIAAGILCGVAVSVKEPYALVPAILGIWALWEIRPLRVALRRSVAIGVISVTTFALEYPFFRLWTGDWMYRHHVLRGIYGPGGKISTEEHVTSSSLLYYSRGVLLNPAICGLFGWLLLIGALYALRKVKEAKFIAIWSVAFFLFLQFGSTTISRYQPLPMQPRYALPIVVLLFIPLGKWLADVVGSPQFGPVGTALLLAALTLQGVMAVDADAAQGLYSANIPRAVQRTLGMARIELPCGIALPKALVSYLPPDLKIRTDCWSKLELNQHLDISELGQLRDRHIAILIPNDLARIPSAQTDYPVLMTWLNQNAVSVPVADGVAFLDRFYLATGISALKRRAKTAVIAKLYVFEGSAHDALSRASQPSDASGLR